MPRCDPEYRPRVGPKLLRPQFIDQQRLDDDRALSNEPRPKPGMANEFKQFQIRIRREEHIYAAAGCEPVAGLIEQRSDIPIVRAAVPGPVGKIARFAGKRRRTR